MDNDDLPIGRVLSRREVLVLFGAAGASLLAACSTGSDSDGSPTATVSQSGPGNPTATTQAAALQSSTGAATATNQTTVATPGAGGATSTSEPVEAAATPTNGVTTLPACVVVPELTEGPYFVDELLDRSDIRSDPADGSIREGALLALTFRVSQINGQGCVAYPGAVVDVWHCDALGVYSDVTDQGVSTVGQQFLRGYQVTDANGIASFVTIYPGWYPGRTVHIHFKIRSEATSDSTVEFTSQLFFDDAFTDQVYLQEPYAGTGERNTYNTDDGIFQGSDDLLTLTCTATPDGFAATFDIGIQSS